MRRRVLTSVFLVIAATVLTLGVPLAVVSWRLVSDLLHRELSGRLQSMEASMEPAKAAAGDIDLQALRVRIPDQGRLVLRVPGSPDRGVGGPPSDDVYSEAIDLPGGRQLILSVEIHIADATCVAPDAIGRCSGWWRRGRRGCRPWWRAGIGDSLVRRLTTP